MIYDEIKSLFEMLLNHPDELDKVNCYIRLRNGNSFHYKMDKKRQERWELREQIRRHKLNLKRKKIEPEKKETL